jgi:hypothetical protein
LQGVQHARNQRRAVQRKKPLDRVPRDLRQRRIRPSSRD